MNRCIQVLATTAVVLLTFSMEARAANVPYVSGGVGADAREELLTQVESQSTFRWMRSRTASSAAPITRGC